MTTGDIVKLSSFIACLIGDWNFVSRYQWRELYACLAEIEHYTNTDMH